MQTGSLAWWMAVDRARERAETKGLLAPPATLVPGAWRGSSYLFRWSDEISARTTSSNGYPVLPALQAADEGASVAETCRAELVRQPALRGQLRMIRERPRNRKGLDADDFALLWRCLQGRDALAFFSAPAASQTDGRLDLEIAPLPLHPLVSLPVASNLIRADLRNGFGRVPEWSFPHLVTAVAPDWLAQPWRGGRIAWVLYLRMRRALQGKSGTGNYHLLSTRRWMWLVPNPIGPALNYAGLISVCTSAQWEALMRHGPWDSLVDSGLNVVPEEAADLCG